MHESFVEQRVLGMLEHDCRGSVCSLQHCTHTILPLASRLPHPRPRPPWPCRARRLASACRQAAEYPVHGPALWPVHLWLRDRWSSRRNRSLSLPASSSATLVATRSSKNRSCDEKITAPL